MKPKLIFIVFVFQFILISCSLSPAPVNQESSLSNSGSNQNPGSVSNEKRAGMPGPEEFKRALKDAYQAYRGVVKGKNADYIPYLAQVDPGLFGLAIATADGEIYMIGDSDTPFAIESISKIFTLARILQDKGAQTIVDKIGVDATGLPFNSVMAIELLKTRAGNPLVNAGAMASVSLVQGETPTRKWEAVIGTMNSFAGRTLSVNEEVYRSESKTNTHNQAIARLLQSYGRFYADPVETLDIYTRQCSVAVTARDLAVMGATLANNGQNPFTGQHCVDAAHISKILALMMTAGLYDASGKWIFNTGLPGKSGVGGGILAVVPGKYAIAAYSPRLDEAGNSVRAQLAIEYLSKKLKANIFSAE